MRFKETIFKWLEGMTQRKDAPWDPAAPFEDNVRRKRGWGTTWFYDVQKGFNFSFDFSGHKDWDPKVTVEMFNEIVNTAANRAGSGPAINGQKFIAEVNTLLRERPDHSGLCLQLLFQC